MSYNPRSANPFAQNEPNKEWTSNNLILQDPNLRLRSGVKVLDSDVAYLYQGQSEESQEYSQPQPQLQPQPQPPHIVKKPQGGGGAKGAPFHIRNFGAKNAQPYEETPQTPAQSGGGYPYHYYTNNKKW